VIHRADLRPSTISAVGMAPSSLLDSYRAIGPPKAQAARPGGAASDRVPTVMDNFARAEGAGWANNAVCTNRRTAAIVPGEAAVESSSFAGSAFGRYAAGSARAIPNALARHLDQPWMCSFAARSIPLSASVTSQSSSEQTRR